MRNNTISITRAVGISAILLAAPLWAAQAATRPAMVEAHSYEEMIRLASFTPAPVRAVTAGPKIHWFGYYDKFQTDPTDRYLLCMEGEFEHRLPGPDDAVKIGMIDLADNNKWIELGQSLAWSWQQGCMLQWLPGSDHEVIWNDREAGHYVCRVLDVKTRTMRTLPHPIEHISPDGRLAVFADFSRIWNIRAGYGYAGVPDAFDKVNVPSETGVWRMDMQTGQARLLASIADLVKVPYDKPSPGHKHYVNHLAWSPDGKRISLFHRWAGTPGQPTRVFTINADGNDLRLLSGHGASHWVWRDNQNMLIWGEGGYKLYADDNSGEAKETLWTAPNGHETYVPGTNNEWIITDTYPQGPKREQILYMVHLPTRRFVMLGRFALPKAYQGEWRCDTHPRLSRNGKWAIIDSPHAGNGRQQYIIDIAPILGGEKTPAVGK